MIKTGILTSERLQVILRCRGMISIYTAALPCINVYLTLHIIFNRQIFL